MRPAKLSYVANTLRERRDLAGLDIVVENHFPFGDASGFVQTVRLQAELHDAMRSQMGVGYDRERLREFLQQFLPTVPRYVEQMYGPPPWFNAMVAYFESLPPDMRVEHGGSVRSIVDLVARPLRLRSAILFRTAIRPGSLSPATIAASSSNFKQPSAFYTLQIFAPPK